MTSDNLRYYAMGAKVPAEASKQFKRAGGFSGTDINPMWRIKAITEMFGPCGIGWYTEAEFFIQDYTKRTNKYRTEIVRTETTEPILMDGYPVIDNEGKRIEITRTETTSRINVPAVEETAQQKIHCTLRLYVRDPDTKEWSKPIIGYGGNDIWSVRREGDIPNDECYKMAETDAFGSACKKLGIGASVYWEADRTKYTIDEETGEVSTHTPTPEEVAKENRLRKAEEAKALAEAGAAKKAETEKVVSKDFITGEDLVGRDAQ